MTTCSTNFHNSAILAIGLYPLSLPISHQPVNIHLPSLSGTTLTLTNRRIHHLLDHTATAVSRPTLQPIHIYTVKHTYLIQLNSHFYIYTVILTTYGHPLDLIWIMHCIFFLFERVTSFAKLLNLIIF